LVAGLPAEAGTFANGFANAGEESRDGKPEDTEYPEPGEMTHHLMLLCGAVDDLALVRVMGRTPAFFTAPRKSG